MTVTEFAILTLKSPPNFSDPTLRSLFEKVSAWQSECSGFSLLFFLNPDEPLQTYLVSGWESVAAHEAWIQGERNKELLRLFAPHVDIANVKMIHVDVDFEAMLAAGNPAPSEDRLPWVIVERYGEFSGVLPAPSTPAPSPLPESGRSSRSTWSLMGRDLTREDGGDMYRFFGADGVHPSLEELSETGVSVLAPVERWVLKRIDI